MDILDSLNQIPKIGINGLIEILLIAIAIYYIVNKLKDTRAWIIIKGILILVGMYGIAYICQFEVIIIIFQYAFIFLAITVVLVLQPEIRKLIERVGINNLNTSLTKITSIIGKKDIIKVEKLISDKTVQEIVKGCAIMGKAKTGALIVIENEIPLSEYIETGIKVDACITSQLLINIFEHNTPLHDGAVIIKDDRIASATCYLPLTNNNDINKDLGTRHRAAIGMSENSDALVVVVSEETGAVSIAVDGVLYHNLDREGLTEGLRQIQTKAKVNLEKTQEKKERRGIQKIRDLIADDTLMKMGVLGVTVVMWVGIMSSANPIITKTINNVPVQLYNIESMEEISKTYEVQRGEEVDVIVRGRKLDIDKIGSKDVVAKANFENLSITNSIPIEVQLTGDVVNLDVELVPSETNVMVAVEDVVTIELPLESNIKAQPSKEYYIRSIETDVDTVVISGAVSLVSKVGNVKLDIDASGINKDTKLKLKPVIYDKNGEQMDETKFELSTEEVETKISLYETKKVPFSVNVMLSNENVRSKAKSVSCNVGEIYIAGSDEILSKTNKVIAPVVIDITLKDISSNQYTKVIDINEFIPAGSYLANKTDRAEVKVTFNGLKTTTHSINKSQIEIRDVQEGLKATIETEELRATIIHYEESINNIKPYIDLSGKEEGIYEVRVKFDGLTEESEMHTEPVVTVNIKKG